MKITNNETLKRTQFNYCNEKIANTEILENLCFQLFLKFLVPKIYRLLEVLPTEKG